MAGKTITLIRNARINGKAYKTGDTPQVTKEIEADLLDAGAIEAEEIEDEATEKKKAK